tara:strand:+ start:114 stop:1586 length:1473 start_codon:yes stop_codon:yes gene_type:complete
MSDIRIAYIELTDRKIINPIFEEYLTIQPSWCSEPPIIEEKIFCGDLNSGISYFTNTARGIPHIPHLFGSLYVRGVNGHGPHTYISKGISLDNNDVISKANIVFIHADDLVFLTNEDIKKLTNIQCPVLIDASFEAFTFTYYYPVLKILNDLFEIGKNFTFIVGGDKTAPTDNLPRAFTEYTGVNIDTFNYFRINEVLVASSGITDHRGSYTHITNETSEEQIIENFNAEKSKDFLCLNNRPRFHRMALLDDLRDNNLLENNYVSRRWQYPAKQHIVQPVIAELWYQHFHSPRMIDELAMYNTTPKQILSNLKKYPEQMIIPELEETVKVNLKDNTPDLLNDRSFSNDIYKNSIYSIAVETYYEPSFIDSYPQVLIKDLTPKPWRAFLTEKVYKPIQYGHMFIPFGMPGTSKVLNKQGFENFHEEFNCSSQYDLDLDHNIRYNTFLEIIKNFDRSRVNSNTLDKIIHNYRRFYDKEQIMNHLSEFLNTYL